MECPITEIGQEDPEKADEKLGKTDLSDADEQYLNRLRDNESQSIDQFDKTVLTLTAGAFAVSFAFLKDILKVDTVTCKPLLNTAWVFWCVSLSCTLISFYVAHLAHRKAQIQFMRGVRRLKNLGGFYDALTLYLNPAAGICFIFGLISMSVFVTTNINTPHAPKTTTAITTNANATATTPAATRAQATIPTMQSSQPSGSSPSSSATTKEIKKRPFDE